MSQGSGGDNHRRQSDGDPVCCRGGTAHEALGVELEDGGVMDKVIDGGDRQLWGLMHRHITHNKCYATFKDFRVAMLTFLRGSVPRHWRTYCDELTDNFRIINPTEFRIIA
jgi:hypothetical protein